MWGYVSSYHHCRKNNRKQNNQKSAKRNTTFGILHDVVYLKESTALAN